MKADAAERLGGEAAKRAARGGFGEGYSFAVKPMPRPLDALEVINCCRLPQGRGNGRSP